MPPRASIAVDLGAESGRVIVGTLSAAPSAAATLSLHEVHRFEHAPKLIGVGLHWDFDRLWSQIRAGLHAAALWTREQNISISSVGVDTWAVDYVLLDDHLKPLESPRCYRDPRHTTGLPLLSDKLGFQRLYELTGLQQAALNTLCQLAGARTANDPILGVAKQLLFIPDYFHLLLSGHARNELTNASTSQMLSASAPDWCKPALAAINIPRALFAPLCMPGTLLGPLRPQLASDTGLPTTTQVVVPCSHDTASAISAVPATNSGWAFLSSGTWSLMGVERTAPILTPQAHAAIFTNERGALGTFRFQKNLVGLWLVQELRRDLQRAGTQLSYAELAAAAASAQPFRTLINPAHPSLAAAGDFVNKLQAIARSTNQFIPATPGELTRCCLESLVLTYRRCIDDLEHITGDRIHTIHIVGGGSQNALLNQMTADATNRRVLAGPVEATAAGNILTQALATDDTLTLQDLRAVVARSFELKEFTPRDTDAWNAAYAKLASMTP